MTQPTPYSRAFGFTDFSSANPTTPHPGTALDAEFNALNTTIDATLVNLALIQRDDTKLANLSVHPAALDADTLALLAAVGPAGPIGPTGPAGADGVGVGTVTSVALSLPAMFTVTGSPLTGAGTLGATLAVQTANMVFAGPSSGAAAAPTFRAMATADITDAIVTLAKQANMATASVFYRKTAAAGPPEVQTLATLKTDLGLTGTNSGDQAVPVEATNAQGWTGSNAVNFISPARMFALAGNVAVTFGATVTLDLNTGLNFNFTATSIFTLANPTNAKSGQSGKIKIKQDATGGRTIAYGTNWKFASGAAVSGVLSTAANAIDHLSYFVEEDGTITSTLAKAFS